MLEEPMSAVPYSVWTSILSWFTPTVFFVFLNLTIGTIYFTSTLRQEPPQRQEPDNNETNPKLLRSPSVLQRLKSVNFYSYRSQDPVVSYERSPDFGGDNGFQFSFQHQIPQYQQPAGLDRSPSVLQKLKSINLYSYFSPEKSHEIRNLQQEDEGEKVEEPEGPKEEITQGEAKTIDEVFSQLNRDNNNNHVTRTTSDTKPASGEVPTKLPRKMRKSASVKSAFRHFEADDIVETRRPATVREGKEKDKAADGDEDEDDEVDAKADDFINKFHQQLKLQKLDSIVRYKEMVNRGNAK